VEPHFDDAALSCSALLERKRPLDLLTALAGEPDPPRRGDWDRICGFADSREGMATRAAEAAAAFAGLPHRLSTLPLLEAQYAGVRDPVDSATLELERAIRDWVHRNPGGLVALPAGAGRRPTGLVGRLVGRRRIRTHPDHLFVRDAGLVALDERWTPLLYEELPYLAGGSAHEEVERLAATLDRKAVVTEPAVDRTQKAARIAAFRSQVRLISPPEMPLDEPSALPAIERYWLLER
jgi:hypothetical protein